MQHAELAALHLPPLAPYIPQHTAARFNIQCRVCLHARLECAYIVAAAAIWAERRQEYKKIKSMEKENRRGRNGRSEQLVLAAPAGIGAVGGMGEI